MFWYLEVILRSSVDAGVFRVLVERAFQLSLPASSPASSEKGSFGSWPHATTKQGC